MDNATLLVAGYAESRPLRLRVGAVIAGLALLFAMVVLVQDRADAAPRAAVAAASATETAVNAQINFNQIFCAVLLSIRNAFAGSPFFSFIAAAINALLVAFGCIPSPGA